MSRFLAILAFLCTAFLLFQFFGEENASYFEASSLSQERVIVAFGDSLTEGYGLPVDQSYPSQLERKLIRTGFLRTHLLNLGVSGDTTKGGLKRIKSVLRANPDIVILALGANDGLRNMNMRETEQNLREAIRVFQKEGIEVLLVGIDFPFLMGILGYTGDFEQMYADISEEFDVPLVPNILEGVMEKEELNLIDGKHPNEKGYQIVAETIWQELKKML